MAAPQSIPRFLLPYQVHLRYPQRRAVLYQQASAINLRHASTTPRGPPTQFPRRAGVQQQKQQKTAPVMPQPDKYRPPSHSKRAPNRDLENKIYGPPISEEDKKRMATKKYPNMMSPEGSFSYWFIHNRILHLWITMGILVTLGISAWWMDFMSKTIYTDLIPTRKDFLRHPYQSTRRFIEVYQMHMMQTSHKYSEQRLKKMDDVEKRKIYRLERQREAEERGEEYITDPRYYIGEDGVRRRRVKRWFGIWE